MSRIIALAPRHSMAVAALHLQYLTTPFHGASGRQLLSSYYQTVASGHGAVGYVAEEQDQILGYICGVWEAAELRKQLLTTRWPALAFWGAVGLLTRPQILALLAQRLGRLPTKGVTQKMEGYELRPIVVVPPARGSSIASDLVQRLMLDARARGFQRMHLYVEVNNETAQAFYRKHGFTATSSVWHNGRPMVSYECSLMDNR